MGKKEEKKRNIYHIGDGTKMESPSSEEKMWDTGVRGAHESGCLVLGDWFPARRRNDQEKDGDD